MPVLLLLGSAECVWRDMEAAAAIVGDSHVAAINEAIWAAEADIEFGASLHPEFMRGWITTRDRSGRNTDFATICPKGRQGYSPDMTVREVWSGSSGLYGVQVAAITFGYKRIVCCGIPLVDMPHFSDGRPFPEARKYHRGWQEAAGQPELAGKVRSMSGFTRDLLGAPDEEWLSGQ